jgi:hypothetical protein
MADQKIMSFSVYLKYLNYDFHEDIIKTMKKKLFDDNLVKKLQEDKESFGDKSDSSVDLDKIQEDGPASEAHTDEEPDSEQEFNSI